MFELFETMKVRPWKMMIVNPKGVATVIIFEFELQEQSSTISPFQNIDSFLGSKDAPLASVIDEAQQLCIKMCQADAVHDCAIVENIQSLQQRCLSMLQTLYDDIKAASDADMIDQCKHTCAKLVHEMQCDVLSVETEAVVSSNDFKTKSTVPSYPTDE